MTSNPSIFETAIADSHDYDEDIRAMALKEKGAEAIYETLNQRDVKSAADEFRPLYGRTEGKDGYVRLEVNPRSREIQQAVRQADGDLGAKATTAFDERVMKVSPCAGNPAEASMLVDVPRLVTADYTEAPDPSVPEQRVAFGTSGHRGSAFEKASNEWHILAISQAICLYREHGDDPAWDAVEADALYDLLEREVIPEFYTRDESGILTAWVKRMRESMARLTPRFSANRTVREYTEQHYLPAASAYRKRTADKGAVGRQMADWRQSLEQKWATLHFGEVQAATDAERHLFRVEVYLNDLDPNVVQVELYADGVNGGSPVRQEMKRVRQLADASGGTVYSAAVSAARPPADYTARLIPHCAGVAIPLEDARILWQR